MKGSHQSNTNDTLFEPWGEDPFALYLPPELTALLQWVLWRFIQRAGETKPTKVPITCMGYPASTTNPNTWSGYEYASKMLREHPDFADGIGFVFTTDDPYCGIDVDNCWPSDTAEMEAWAASIVERFSDTYHEQSPSGLGLKIWCQATAPHCGRWPIGTGAVEVYDRARFFTVTGQAGEGVPRIVTGHQRDIEELVFQLDRLRRGGPRKHSGSRGIGEKIPTGKRHNTLVSLAGTMFRRGMHVESIRVALQSENELRCDPPRTPDDVDKIVNSMRGWAQ